MERLDGVSPFLVMDVIKRAREIEASGEEVIHFEVGQPDLEPSPSVWRALEKAVKKKKNQYIESLGLWELREKISEFYYKKYRVDVSPSRVIITTGTSAAFTVAYSIFLDFGQKLILTDPSYPCYKNFAKVLGIKVKNVGVSWQENYELKPNQIDDDAAAVHISSPMNPTGSLYPRRSLENLALFCKEKGITLISDEIYHGLVYDEPEHTALEFSDEAVVINGFSKAFCMPGFRIGWLIVPEKFVRKAEIVLQNLFICAPTLSQYAALGAFDYDYLDYVKMVFKERRNFLYQELKRIFDIRIKPKGAFYIWADVSKYSNDGLSFSKLLLEEAKVATTPGIDFGKNKTQNYVRFAFTQTIAKMAEGIRRIKRFLGV